MKINYKLVVDVEHSDGPLAGPELTYAEVAYDARASIEATVRGLLDPVIVGDSEYVLNGVTVEVEPMDEITPARRVVDLDKVCDIMSREHHVKAYVEQTGGGCATIYAGPKYTDDSGDGRYAIVAGPGWFEPTRLGRHGVAALDDFYIGVDDDGMSDVLYAYTAEDEMANAGEVLRGSQESESDVAARIAAAVNTFVTEHPGLGWTEEES